MEFKTNSGVPVVINPAPFEDALALQNVVGNPVLGINTQIGPDFNIDNTAKAHVLAAVASNAAVQKEVMKCLTRCTYDGQKITPTTFEEAKAREDYFEVAVACVQENIRPFVNSLFLQFSGLLEAMKVKPASSQK